MKDLKDKSVAELKTLLAEKREKVREFRFGLAGAATRNVKVAKNTKREIAQILTELTKRTEKAA